MLRMARREFALLMNRCHELPNVVRARRLLEDAEAVYGVYEEIPGALCLLACFSRAFRALACAQRHCLETALSRMLTAH